MKKVFFLILFIIASISYFYAQSQKEKIVILNFKPINIDKVIADAVTENLMTSVVDLKVFQVIERAQLDKILGELKLTSKEEFDDQTAMQVGKLAKAKIVLVGSVTKLGRKITINARGIEVETGNVAFGKSIVAKNEDELSEKAQELASLISNKESSSSTAGTVKSDNNLIKRTIAILPYFNSSNATEYEYLTDTLRDGLRAKLQAGDTFNFVSFNAIGDGIKKLRYQKSDLIDEKKAISLALYVKADVVITGKYTVVKDKVMITSNALDVLGEQSVIGSNVNGDAGVEVFELVEKSSNEMAAKIAKEFPSVDKKLLDQLIAKREKTIEKEEPSKEEDSTESKRDRKRDYKSKYTNPDYLAFTRLRNAGIGCVVSGSLLAVILGAPLVAAGYYLSTLVTVGSSSYDYYYYSYLGLTLDNTRIIIGVGVFFLVLGSILDVVSIPLFVVSGVYYAKWQKAIKTAKILPLISYRDGPVLGVSLKL